MLLSDVICFALLTITVTATCVGGQVTRQELAERKPERRRRESAVLIDSYPLSTHKAKPNIIVRRASKSKYRKPKPKYGPPRPKYGPSIKLRKPIKSVKKPRRKPSRPNKSKRSRNPKYTPNKKIYYGTPKMQRPYLPYYAPEPVGFAEPPKTQPLQHSYGEPPVDSYGEPPVDSYGKPPVDSYGAPLSPSVGSFPTGESIAESNDYANTFGQQHQSFKSYQQDLNIDNINSNTHNSPIYAEHEASDDHPSKYYDFNLKSYEDVFKQSPLKDHVVSLRYEKYKDKLPGAQKNKLWKNKVKPEESRDHIVVGGQYAEPPGRLVPSFQPSAPAFAGPEEFSPLRYLDSEVASATISPYVNYKNSNMAFSPQNLNDAFSILD